MPVICPTVTAKSKEEYDKQMRLVGGFAHRIQIDLADGEFAKGINVNPQEAWWPAGVKADFHLMYRDPLPAIEAVVEHQPNLIIVHAEADGDFADFIEICEKAGVKAGVALLEKTDPVVIVQALPYIDHVLFFSGVLGKFGGKANLKLLEKVKYLKSHKPQLEIGWDGGVNDQNVSELILGGVDVLNVGGFIHKSDDPERTFKALERIADETGTT
jgi:pentose-5-phosphate-3-epimerase